MPELRVPHGLEVHGRYEGLVPASFLGADPLGHAAPDPPGRWGGGGGGWRGLPSPVPVMVDYDVHPRTPTPATPNTTTATTTASQDWGYYLVIDATLSAWTPHCLQRRTSEKEVTQPS